MRAGLSRRSGSMEWRSSPSGTRSLSAPLDRAADVKLLVDRLQAEGPRVRSHAGEGREALGIVTRRSIQGPRFQIKRIVVGPGERLSLQKHFQRSEHWVVVQGTPK